MTVSISVRLYVNNCRVKALGRIKGIFLPGKKSRSRKDEVRDEAVFRSRSIGRGPFALN